MQMIKCKHCGQEAKLERQSVEYVVKQEDGVEVFVLSKMTFVFDCPKCGLQNQEEVVTQD